MNNDNGWGWSIGTPWAHCLQVFTRPWSYWQDSEFVPLFMQPAVCRSRAGDGVVCLVNFSAWRRARRLTFGSVPRQRGFIVSWTDSRLLFAAGCILPLSAFVPRDG